MRQAKFEVRFTWPNLLYISWRHHEADYLTRKNPIIKAMMPEPIAPPKAVGGKKKGPNQAPLPASRPAVAFNDEIDIINMPQATPLALTQHRRAIDYEPPPSFIQNMERPGPGRQMQSGREQMQSHSGSGQGQGQGQREMQTGAKGNVLADLWSFN